jgi:hypothetical protein
MTSIRPSIFLRRALLADAIASGASAALMIAGANILDTLLALPSALLQEAGLVLVPFVAFVAWLGTREFVMPAAVWAVIIVNTMWAVGSGLLLVSGLVAPSLLGYAFVLAQALVVALFAELQYVGLRKPHAGTA